VGLKQVVASMTPLIVKRRIRLWKESRQLESTQRAECKAEKLRDKNDISLGDIFNSHEIESMWHLSEKEIKQFSIPDGTGGVNPGDRRAIYYLINAIRPLSVLEIGTHIGASTIHIAPALRHTAENDSNLITVDISDVNSQIEKPWLKHGTTHSPIEMIDKMDYGSFVQFITDSSLHYMVNTQNTFDFIFLDGDHGAATVYQEIALALNLLNRDGVILLHDYFPDTKPLWSNGSVISGPFLATEKLRREGMNVTVLPLGKLPWPTKLGSNVTSLALLLRDG
jgi:predicted O-methyltransferase YrrM